MRRIGGLILTLVSMVGCELPTDHACTAILKLGIEVTAVDSVTAEPITEEGARAVARDGDYVEELERLGTYFFLGAAERPGRYSITVLSPSYEPWYGSAIVLADACHVHTVELTARLVPKD